MPDDFDDVKRSINLIDYAQYRGYKPNALESSHGLTVLELERAQGVDRIAVAQTRSGEWAYASLSGYSPRRSFESGPAGPLLEDIERVRERQRACIAQTRDKGSAVDLVQHVARVQQLPPRSVEHVQAHLRSWHEAQRALEKADWLLVAYERARTLDASGHGASRQRLTERMYAFPAQPNGPTPPELTSKAEVEERLRRWDEAQRAIGAKIERAAELARPQNPPSPLGHEHGKAHSLETAPTRSAPTRAQSELNQRRYDWSPPPSGGEHAALVRAPRPRTPDRGR